MLGLLGGASLALNLTTAQPAAAGQTPEVGSYLPAAQTDGFVVFIPDKKKTPVSSRLYWYLAKVIAMYLHNSGVTVRESGH
jgi:hypothetical protein